jgi:hypothetical protein
MNDLIWRTELRNIADLKPYHKNPRKLSKEQYEHLKVSVDKFGLIDKPIINVDGTIIGGHKRLEVLKRMNHKRVECHVPNRIIEDKDLQELNIRLNKNTGDWDWDILANQWDTQDLLDWGFTEDELNFDISTIASEEPDDEVMEPTKDPKTKPGDIYDLGEHRIICADSTNLDSVHALLGSIVPILMVTDPPYGVNYDPKWRDPLNKRKDGTTHTARGKVQNDDKVNWALAWHLFSGSLAILSG